jgi:hypothetical protein
MYLGTMSPNQGLNGYRAMRSWTIVAATMTTSNMVMAIVVAGRIGVGYDRGWADWRVPASSCSAFSRSRCRNDTSDSRLSR